MSQVALSDAIRIEPETAFDTDAITRVVDDAFGPGRFAKTAERLREDATPLCGFVARRRGRVIGSVRLWPIEIGGVPATFLGPIAVEAEERSSGVGADMVAACIDCAKGRGAGVLLVGDVPYFGRFGFGPAPEIVLPGPVDQRRVLWLGFDGVAPTGLARSV